MFSCLSSPSRLRRSMKGRVTHTDVCLPWQRLRLFFAVDAAPLQLPICSPIRLGPGGIPFPSESCKLTNRPPLFLSLAFSLSFALFELPSRSSNGPLVEDFVWRLAAVRSETPTRHTTSIFVPNLLGSEMQFNSRYRVSPCYCV